GPFRAALKAGAARYLIASALAWRLDKDPSSSTLERLVADPMQHLDTQVARPRGDQVLGVPHEYGCSGFGDDQADGRAARTDRRPDTRSWRARQEGQTDQLAHAGLLVFGRRLRPGWRRELSAAAAQQRPDGKEVGGPDRSDHCLNLNV